MPGSNESQSFTWLLFAVMTFACWGVYGIFLHKGQVQMHDPDNGRYKAFLFVGIAYFLTAVIAPLVVLVINKSTWQFPAGGMTWSLLAGIVGAAGAFGVLLAFGAAPKPTVRYVPVVMSIIFAGAPIVNAVVAVTMAGYWKHTNWQFVAGIAFAAIGGCLVTLYKPSPPAVAPSSPPAADVLAAPSTDAPDIETGS